QGARQRVDVGTLERDRRDLLAAREPETGETARGVCIVQRPGRELVEEVALQPSFGIGHGAGLRQLDREQGERVSGDDTVQLTGLFWLADREERLDSPLCTDGLHPDVVPLVDERQAEAGAVGA